MTDWIIAAGGATAGGLVFTGLAMLGGPRPVLAVYLIGFGLAAGVVTATARFASDLRPATFVVSGIQYRQGVSLILIATNWSDKPTRVRAEAVGRLGAYRRDVATIPAQRSVSIAGEMLAALQSAGLDDGERLQVRVTFSTPTHDVNLEAFESVGGTDRRELRVERVP